MPKPKSTLSPHLQGLFGVLLALAVLALLLVLLHLRRNGQPVDPGELQTRADSPCMVAALRKAMADGHTPTYAELDRIQAGCGE